MVNVTRRLTLNLNDIIDDETEKFKENVNPIYEFVFTLANGVRIEKHMVKEKQHPHRVL
jgi:hypothetical protein